MFVLAFLFVASASAIFVPAENVERAVREASGHGYGHGMTPACAKQTIDRGFAVSTCKHCLAWIEKVCKGSTQRDFEKGFDKLRPCPCNAKDLRENGTWKDGWSEDGACKYVGCPGGNPPAGHCAPYHTGSAYCVRGIHPSSGQGQQCCYDCGNKLVLCPEDGAGTTDGSPGVFPWVWHVGHDVSPFSQCCGDGNSFTPDGSCTEGFGSEPFTCELNGVPVCNYYFIGRPSNYGEGGYSCCNNKSPDPRCPCYSCAGSPFSDDTTSSAGSDAWDNCNPDNYNTGMRPYPRHKDCGCCAGHEDAPDVVWDGEDAPTTAQAYAAGLYVQQSPAPASSGSSYESAYDGLDVVDYQDGR